MCYLVSFNLFTSTTWLQNLTTHAATWKRNDLLWFDQYLYIIQFQRYYFQIVFNFIKYIVKLICIREVIEWWHIWWMFLSHIRNIHLVHWLYSPDWLWQYVLISIQMSLRYGGKCLGGDMNIDYQRCNVRSN